MKRIAVTTIGLCFIALVMFAFNEQEKPIKIELKQSDVAQYQKHLANIVKMIEPSDLKGKQIVYIKSQIDSATLVLLKNIKQVDTLKNKK